MAIAIGANQVTKMYLGGTQLSAVYLGVQSLLGALVQPLRAVSPANRTANLTTAGSAAYSRHYASRIEHYIGSGDCSELCIRLDNWAIGNGGLNTATSPVTYGSVWLEHEATNQTKQVFFSGQAGLTLQWGDYDVLSDAILPSLFGLAKFTKGERVYIRSITSIPVSGSISLTTANNSSNGKTLSYDPAATSYNIGGTGALVATGAAGGQTYFQNHLLLGRFVAGDPRTWLGVGDSILDGSGDISASSGKVGAGYFTRALYSTTPLVNPIGGINAAKPSGSTQAWVGGDGDAPVAQLFSLVKYCNTAVFEYGTNKFTNAANGNDSNRLYGYQQVWGCYHHLRLNAVATVTPFKILHATMMPRTTEIGFSDASAASQEIMGPQWDIGGDAHLYNMQFTSDVGVTDRNDAIFDPGPYTRLDYAGGPNVTNYHKWLPNSTTDGTHPGTSLHATIGAALRTQMLSF